MADGKLNATIKAGEGYDAPWIVISGDSIQELEYHLNQLAASQVASLTLAISSDFRDDFVQEKRARFAPPPSQPAPPQDPWAQQEPPPEDPWASKPAPQDPWSTPSRPSAPQTPQRPAGNSPVCQCGQAMELKETSTHKQVWRCPSWRWNNGNETKDHDQAWPDKM